MPLTKAYSVQLQSVASFVDNESIYPVAMVVAVVKFIALHFCAELQRMEGAEDVQSN